MRKWQFVNASEGRSLLRPRPLGPSSPATGATGPLKVLNPGVVNTPSGRQGGAARERKQALQREREALRG